MAVSLHINLLHQVTFSLLNLQVLIVDWEETLILNGPSVMYYISTYNCVFNYCVFNIQSHLQSFFCL